MKTALLDSSIWISYYLQDSHYPKSEEIIESLLKAPSTKIFLPTIVYIEVINTLLRAKVAKEKIQKIKKLFLNSQNIKIIHAPKFFWINKVEKYANLVTLKSSDLIILANVFEYKAALFYSFDRKLLREYQLLKNIYEKN